MSNLDYGHFQTLVDKYKDVQEAHLDATTIVQSVMDNISFDRFMSPTVSLLDDVFLSLFYLFYNFDEDYLAVTDREIEYIYRDYIDDDISFPEFEDAHRRHIVEERKFLAKLQEERGLPAFIRGGNVTPLPKRK